LTNGEEIIELIRDVREQVVFMGELGITGLDVKLDDAVAALHPPDVPVKAEPVPFAPPPPELAPGPSTQQRTQPARPAGSRLSELPSLSQRKPTPFFDKYNPADGDRAPAAPGEVKPLIDVAPALPEPTETVEQIRAEIGPDCTRCKLCQLGRTRVVNSVGNFNADLMFVGEAPGADEDRLGEPFVGRAGQLLTDIIRAIGFDRSEVFIGNINRCRPPGNRTPEPDEAVVCKPYLLREIAVVRPKVIVVLGAHAAQTLLETKTPISRMRGRFHDYVGVKVMPTFHPAYLLRDPNKKRDVWEDMKKVRDYLAGGSAGQ